MTFPILENKIHIAVVNYLNSRPFLAGLERYPERYAVITDSPAGLADRLVAGEVDIALLPVAMIPHLPEAHIVSRYGIASDGPVKTVCIFSHQPIEQLDTIFLDYQSRSSVLLVQILCREYWHVNLRFAAAYPGYEGEISGNKGGLVIGDRTIHLLEQFPYVYDLAEAWKVYTGLPFVFAAWVSARPVDEQVMADLDAAFEQGLATRADIASQFATYDHALFSTKDYLFRHIQYELTEPVLQGMRLFLGKYGEMNE
jgi:chorismate dehydratase